MVRASKKCSSMTFIEVDISRRFAKIAKFVLRDLDLNFLGQTFQMANLTSYCWKNANMTIVIRKSGICHRMAPLRMLYFMTVTYLNLEFYTHF